MQLKRYLILGIGLCMVLGIALFFIFVFPLVHSSPLPAGSGSKQHSEAGPATLVKAEDITYVLDQVGFSSLHNPLLSSNTPKTVLVIDGVSFTAEVAQGKIMTRKGSIADPDLRIRTRGDIVLEAKSSSDVKTYFKERVKNGKIQIEQVASKTELFTKGYLSLYDSLK